MSIKKGGKKGKPSRLRTGSLALGKVFARRPQAFGNNRHIIVGHFIWLNIENLSLRNRFRTMLSRQATKTNDRSMESAQKVPTSHTGN
jgi:hypothetical protein